MYLLRTPRRPATAQYQKDAPPMPADPLLHRLRAVRQALADVPLDAALLTHPVNIGYVTGFTGSTAYALMTRDEAVLITDPRYTLRARQECPHFAIAEASGSGSYGEALSKALAAWPTLRRLGFEAAHVSVAQWQKFTAAHPAPLEWVPTESLVEAGRAVKDAGEVDAIRRAIAVAEAAFVELRPLLKPGALERDLALALDTAMRRGGADAAAFETIVASGPQGARPHHTPNSRALETGDFVTIDWGASVGGYCSDITRTVVLGEPTPRQREVYDAVREAQARAIAAIRPGRTGKEIDSVAREYLAAQGLGEAFGHGLGHALGREVHDGPGLSPRMEGFVLAPGMVQTVEPGVYLEGWGGLRLEEDVLVTPDGCEVLTRLPNTLDVIRAGA